MIETSKFIEHFKEMNKISPIGCAIGLHIEYTKATFMFESYPSDWISFYAENGLLLSDPTVAWGFQNDGSIDWSHLSKDDPEGVLTKASAYGLKFGATCALELNELRSIGSFARRDRPFRQDEIDTLYNSVRSLCKLTADRSPLDQTIVSRLSDMGVKLSQNL